MTSETTTTTETWDRLENSPEMAALTPQQAVWLVAFLASAGSTLAATKTAYHTRDESQAKVMSYEVAAKPAVKDALALANGTANTEPSREELIAETRRQLRAADKGSIAADRFQARLERLTKPDVKSAEEDRQPATPDLVEADTKFEVGSVVEQDGHRYKIVAEEIS